MIRVSAPGKLMIAGEYAVLHGHRAMVAAVDRRARLTLDPDGSSARGNGSPGQPGLPPEALVARQVAEQRLGAVPGTMRLDVKSLRNSGQDKKLGLGSSAAAAAAAAGAIHAAHGRDLEHADTRREILDDAMRGHRQVAPRGSGADVAASTLGGIVAFRREGEAFDASPAWLPDDIEVRVVWSGAEARTSELVARVAALAERDRPSHDAAIARIADSADAFIDTASSGRTAALLKAVEAHGAAMADLGVRANAPIVDPRLLAVMSLAAEAGGAAKPSGAGGGDVAIAFFADDDAAHRFETACAEADFPLLSLELGGNGIAVDPEPEDQ